MSNRNYTFEEVKRRFQSIAGIEAMTASDEFFFENSLNRAAYEAYGTSNEWPRYIVVGEERSLNSDNIVPFAESGKDNIEEFMRIHRGKSYFNNSELEFDFYVDSNGANLVNANPSEEDVVYATYKKEWDGPYAYDSSSIPGEFVDFIIYSCLADFYQGDGQSENAQLMRMESQKFLTNELIKIQKTKNRNIFGTWFKNHTNMQSR